MGEKGAFGFAQGISSFQKGLTLLNLADNGITPKGTPPRPAGELLRFASSLIPLARQVC